MDYLSYFAQDCLKYIPPQKLCHKKVLVVGCGEGKDCKSFLDAQGIDGIDVGEHIGREFIHDKVKYFQESAESMARPDNYYDIVFSAATMEHIGNLKAAFSEMFRVTKPGGLIYCVSAPLWNSYEGHHQYGLFSEYPWIHLRLSPSEILRYIQQNKQIQDLEPLVELLKKYNLLSVPLRENDRNTYAENVVNFMFSDYFNRRPSTEYLEVTSKLDVSYVIRSDIWQDKQELLTDAILHELKNKNFSPEELLSVAHTYVAIK